MVKVESKFTLKDLIDFAKSKYEAFNVKSKKRAYAYYRQVASLVAIEGGYRLSLIAKALGVSHPTVIWSRDIGASRLASRDEKFVACYTDFVNKFNEYLKEKALHELSTPVNSGESIDS